MAEVVTRSHPSSGQVPWNTSVAYGAPIIGIGYMYLVLSLYVMKFSTDVLLIAPAVMGLIFSVSRIWDAISDPIVGYLSDRTRNSFGRRRTWIAASLIPTAGAFVMVFSPPESFTDGELVAWMAIAIIGFYSATTLFYVPHLSLGAELSDNYHERSRLFGVRHAFYTFGSILSLISFYILIKAEQEGPEVVRQTAFNLAILVVIATSLVTIFAVSKLSEREDFQGRINDNPFQAFADIRR